jgi:hypothetical protein
LPNENGDILERHREMNMCPTGKAFQRRFGFVFSNIRAFVMGISLNLMPFQNIPFSRPIEQEFILQLLV